MPNPTPKTKSPAEPSTQDRRSRVASGPTARVLVQHLRGSEGPPRFHFKGADASRVEVDDHGEVRIDWHEDDAEARIVFELTSPHDAFIDGFLMGWRGDGLVTLSPQPVSYRLASQPGDGGKDGGGVRVMIVELDRSVGVYTYSLHVLYPDGSTDRIDPKIYNQGDGFFVR